MGLYDSFARRSVGVAPHPSVDGWVPSARSQSSYTSWPEPRYAAGTGTNYELSVTWIDASFVFQCPQHTCVVGDAHHATSSQDKPEAEFGCGQFGREWAFVA